MVNLETPENISLASNHSRIQVKELQPDKVKNVWVYIRFVII